ncbi:MAG TPA: CarD family transcriptional regulator [Candidatus Babeliales bacterium]|jgi:CarD family transcriptional regulator|nr:CarD family transcriptional regulator [Candidatus Babeliales bacterium]
MYALKQKVVYPGKGVAYINSIIQKQIANNTAYFYELVFLHHQDLTILVPIENASTIGIRPLCSRDNIAALFALLAEPPPVTIISEPLISNWNKRNKGYKEKLQTGDPREICRIYRYLKHLSTKKELSFGEKDLLKQTEFLLAEEVAQVHGIHEEKATEQIRKAITFTQPHIQP